MNRMRVAVAYDNGKIYQHLGHTKHFKIYDVVDGSVQASSLINTSGRAHGALASLLKMGSVDVLICGRISDSARRALTEVGIALYGGVTGSADKAVEKLIAQKL